MQERVGPRRGVTQDGQWHSTCRPGRLLGHGGRYDRERASVHGAQSCASATSLLQGSAGHGGPWSASSHGFGSPAVSLAGDPWLCVPTSRWVCRCRPSSGRLVQRPHRTVPVSIARLCRVGRSAPVVPGERRVERSSRVAIHGGVVAWSPAWSRPHGVSLPHQWPARWCGRAGRPPRRHRPSRDRSFVRRY